MTYLLDTNVLSAARRRTPAAVEWLRAVDPATLFLSVITIGEIAKGIALRARTAPVAAAGLDEWLDTLRRIYADRILAIDDAVAVAWGRLMAQRTCPTVDALIAATARVHNLVLVTRNVTDFADTGVDVVNPWAGYRAPRRPGTPSTMPRRKPRGRPLDGWLIIDKPPGLTSTDVVNRVRRAFDAQKAGHGGTLDPLATGVLPIAFGAATKTVPYVMDGTKLYRFTLRFGEARDTDDADGKVTETTDARPTDAQIIAALPAFCGDIMQIPPAFSAVKIAGERAYDMAREGRAAGRWNLAPPGWTGLSWSSGPTPTTRCSRSPRARASICAAWRATWRAPAAAWAMSRRCAGCGSGRSSRRRRSRWTDCRWTQTIPRRLPRTCCFRSRPRWPTSRRWP